MELAEENLNPLFNRREVRVKITDRDVPPSKPEAAKIISEKFGVPEEHIHVDEIEARFGKKVFTIIAEVYNTPAEKTKLRTINKRKKKAAKA